MATQRRVPKYPYMIMREDGDGDDFAVTREPPHGSLQLLRWEDWEGTRFKEREAAQRYIDNCEDLSGAKVIEVLEEVRVRTRG
jgi:hypothetical protein